MTLLWPASLLALLAVPAAILIALWRARRRDLVVPSLMLWKRLEERIAQSGHQRRKLVDIALVAAALAALFLALAAAGPLLRRETARTANLLVIVDLSASMGMMQDGESRLQIALKQLDSMLPEFADATLYLATSPATVQAPAIREISSLDLQNLKPLLRPKSLTRDITGILAAATEIQPFESIVITDAPDEIPDGMATIGIGGNAENLFFSRFGHSGQSLLLGLRHAGAAGETGLRLFADGEPLHDDRIAFGADERTIVIDHPSLAAAEVLEAVLETDDALSADNRFYAVRSPERKIRVLLAGRHNNFIEAALRLHPNVELVRGTPPGDASEAAAFDLLIYNGISPAIGTGRKTVVIDPPQSFDGVTVAGEHARPAVSDNTEEALMLGLADAGVARARLLNMTGRIIAGSNRGPLVVRRIDAPGQYQIADLTVVSFAVSRENTDWILSPGFPVFWARILEEIGPTRPHGFVFNRLGECVSMPVGETATLRRIRPDYQDIRSVEPGEFAFCPDVPGVYKLRSGGDVHLMAFNFFDAAESSRNGVERTIDVAKMSERVTASDTSDSNLLIAAALAGMVFLFTYWYCKQ